MHCSALVLRGVLAACVGITFGCSKDPEVPQNQSTTGMPLATTVGVDSGAGVTTGGGPATSAGTGIGSGGAATTGAVTGATGLTPPGEDGPVSIDHCGTDTSGLSQAQLDALLVAGSPGSARMLYPYDGTVFPRGLQSPLVMWDGVAGVEAVYVHMKSTDFEYKGCLTPTAEGQLQLPQDVWQAAGAKTGGNTDPFAVDVSWLSGGQVVGPVSQHWVIARATFKGSVYYNSYTSLSGTGIGGKVFRIPPGGQAEPFLDLECNGCHSVSANGERMTSQTLGLGARSYDLRSGDAQQVGTPATAPYAALYPDGSRFVSNSLVTDVARSVLVSSTAVLAGTPLESQLYDTDTGTMLPSSGIPGGALMPTFSPDGRFLVFNDFDINSAHGLALVEFDGTNNTATGYKKLFEESSLRPGWPFMLPDNGGVVFVLTDGLTFSADGAGVAGGFGAEFAPYSELFMVDADSGEYTMLARAMGYDTEADAAAGKTYLPFGAEDTRRVFFPTVSPVAAGGYFWVFFDALRHYGNQGMSRQLWGTAIEIDANGNYGVDRSAPAFYLPGQEFGTGNHRAFTALDPCKDEGGDCRSSVDCCVGTCEFPEDGLNEFSEPVGQCQPIDRCSMADERCETAEDCCPVTVGDLSLLCIAGFCAPVPLI